MDADRPSSRNAVFEEVIQKLLEKADNKESFGIVLRELLSKKDEINEERANVAKLEAVLEERAKVAKLEVLLSAKEEMERKQEKLRERYEEARDAERKEAKEAQASLLEKMERQQAALVEKLQQQQLRHEALLKDERKELIEERNDERRESQERQDQLMARLFEQQGKQTEKIHRLEPAAAQHNNGNIADAPGTTKTQIHMAGPPALIPTPNPRDDEKTSFSRDNQNPAPDEHEAPRVVSSKAVLEEAFHDDQ